MFTYPISKLPAHLIFLPFLLTILLWSSVAASSVDVVYLPEGVLAKRTDRGVVGAFPDIIREAARRQNRSVQLQPMAWKRAQQSAQTENNSAILPITRVASREDNYQWIATLLPLKLSYLTLKGNYLQVTKLEDLWGKQVAVLSGSVADAITRNHPQGKHFTRVTHGKSAVMMLKRRRIDGWLIWNIFGIEAIREEGVSDQIKQVDIHTVGPLYLAANKELSEEAIISWRQTISSMHQDGFIKKTLEQYYGDILKSDEPSAPNPEISQ